jgi:hypothetical protein
MYGATGALFVKPLPHLIRQAGNMELETFQLKDIEIGRMKLIKETCTWHGNQDHSRWVFKDSKKSSINSDKHYFKIWNPTYIRRDNLLKALEAGFLDEQTTPALSGLIVHKGLCRGYVMKECKPDLKLSLNESYYKLIKEKSKYTGFFHIQFSPCHVMKYEGRFSLIDLEGIFPLSELDKMPEYFCYFDYKDYEDFITGLYNESAMDSEKNHRYLYVHGKKHFRKIHPFFRINQSLLLRAWNTFREKRGNHIRQIVK